MNKPALTIAEQLTLLKERKLSYDVGDRNALGRLLLSKGYYRLSGYWRYFQVSPHNGDNTFNPGITLGMINDVYEFDEILRSILLEGLTAFEVTFRTRLAYFFSTVSDPYDYLSLDLYRDEVEVREGRKVELRVELVADIKKELSRSREDFIRSHLSAQKPIPLWVAVEVLSMGTVSKMYRLLLNDDVRYPVSKSFGYPDPEFTETISRSFSTLRNKCAHSARIWNHSCVNPPRVLKDLKTDKDKSIYSRTPWSFIVMLASAVDGINATTSYSADLFGHIDKYPEFRLGLTHPHRR
jgi:abortive infection bacteriophage resistance protein